MERKKLEGRRFGRLLVLRAIGKNKDGGYRWLCKCDCGIEKIINYSQPLLRGKTRGCGCTRIPRVIEVSRKLGACKPNHRWPEYRAWESMKRRCYACKPGSEDFRLYRGRGIQVSNRWLTSFENFFTDMGKKPSRSHSLDRYPDREGNYEPSNCRWATPREQANNRRPRSH